MVELAVSLECKNERMNMKKSKLQIGDVALELLETGEGEPLLFLHGEDFFQQNIEFLELLGSEFKVYAPRHPGFGYSSLPDKFTSIDDLAYFYLDLLEYLDLKNVTLVGSSMGGWIASEICVRCVQRISRLVLINSVGGKFGDREVREIVDIWATPEDELQQRMFVNPASLPHFSDLPDEDLKIIVQDRVSAARFCWAPYMHNPVLTRWLHRIKLPTLVLWGENDGVVGIGYGSTLARHIIGSIFQIVQGAAHYPQTEEPQVVFDKIVAFASH
jgi:pimeloyl-ACP methyl ester carboxylesterase